MPGAIVAVFAACLLASTGLAAAAALRMRSLPEFAIAGFVLAFAEVVALVLALSPFGAVRRPVLLTALVALCGGAVLSWWRSGAPRPPVPRPGAPVAPLAVLAVAVSGALSYVVALLLGTPPTTWDSLTYHLTRAALWRQDGGIGYIGDAYDGRMNANPPNTEIVLTFVLELTRNERIAGVVQLLAALTCVAAIFTLARRAIRLTKGEAAFGSLLFLTLPVVILQASTTQNDLVVASLLLAATVFALEGSRQALLLASIATALALGTKVTAVYGVPLLAAIALLSPPRSARFERIAAIGIGVVLGSYWYVVNLVETGRVLGRRPDTDLVAVGDLRENLLAGLARVHDAFDLSGARLGGGAADSDVLLYVVSAAVLVALLLLVGRLQNRSAPRDTLVAGALSLAPLIIPMAGYAVWRVFSELHDLLGGEAKALPAGGWRMQTTASESVSWFGPLGLLLVGGAALAGVALWRRRALPPLTVLLAVAPVIWLVLVSLTIGYDIWQGRFFMYPVALSAVLWGLILRAAPLAWAAVAIASTTVVLSFVNSIEKPSGVQLFADRPTPSVWRMERWEAQSYLRPRVAPVLRFLETRIPDDATVALALSEDEFGYPAFGAGLERRVELVELDSPATGMRATWLVAGRRRAAEIDSSCWTTALETKGGTVFRRHQTCLLPSSSE